MALRRSWKGMSRYAELFTCLTAAMEHLATNQESAIRPTAYKYLISLSYSSLYYTNQESAIRPTAYKYLIGLSYSSLYYTNQESAIRPTAYKYLLDCSYSSLYYTNQESAIRPTAYKYLLDCSYGTPYYKSGELYKAYRIQVSATIQNTKKCKSFITYAHVSWSISWHIQPAWKILFSLMQIYCTRIR
jgi:hypothetical protein